MQKYWQDRYKKLKKDGVVGNMAYNNENDDRIKMFWNSIKDVIKSDVTKGYLIDYGCGTAKMHNHLKEHFKLRYIGVDIIDFVNKDNESKYPESNFITTKIPTDISGDGGVIWSSFVFQHIENKKLIATLKQLAKCLSKGGKMFSVDCVKESKDDENMFFRNEKKYISLFKQAGFKAKVLKEVTVTGSRCVLFECSK